MTDTPINPNRRAFVHNAITQALADAGDWVPLSVRIAATRAALAEVDAWHAAGPRQPAADRADLRQRIAEALLDHLSRTADIRPSKAGPLAFMPEITDEEQLRLADAVLAVLPVAADRAAVLREAADFVGNDDDCDCGVCDSCVPNKLAAGLRGLADEAQHPTPRTIQCAEAFWTNQPHPAHDWKQRPDADAVHCPGIPIEAQSGKETSGCGPAPAQCDADTGEPCDTHERQQSHIDGDHSLCRRADCEVLRQS